ncbi:MAG: STAS domain-containing protein [Chlamydiota bacterium]|nr:STAS domain-containing protein [Chlamydiota bacterium]
MMSEENVIEVGTTGKKAFIRIKGRGDFINSQPLKEFIQGMINNDLSDILVDLKECKTMDSTFMGVLAGTALELKNKYNKTLTLFNVEEHNIELLTTLGIHMFVNMLPGDSTEQPNEYKSLKTSSANKKQMTEEMLQAHSTLMEISEENRVKFKDVYEYLKDELRKNRD